MRLVCLSLSHTHTHTPHRHTEKPLKTHHTQRAFILCLSLPPDRGSRCHVRLERVGAEELNQNSLGKERRVCLSAKVSVEKPENLPFRPDYPGQITLLKIYLT